MLVYHQTGHNYVWNYDSYTNDNAGNGLIFSPVNIPSEKLVKLDKAIKENSFFDPQFYLPKEIKGKLETYKCFPANIVNGFQTDDFENLKNDIAKLCIDFQLDNWFKFLLIPTRYFEVIPSDYLNQIKEYFIEPFLNYYLSNRIQKEIYLTVIVNQDQLLNDERRNILLNFITSIQDISGIYLIFENKYPTKQIKNLDYLFNAMLFIHALKLNNFKVNIGYTNTEGILYSIVGPESITMGSYENLRQFSIQRFINCQNKTVRQPNPRLYSRKLFQWIDYRYIEGLQKLYKNWQDIFEDSKYKPLMFEPTFNWHFNKPEPYKHFFLIFSSQINDLPICLKERIHYLQNIFNNALRIYHEISEAGVYLDENSDGSHINFWLTCIKMFEKYLRESNYELSD